MSQSDNQCLRWSMALASKVMARPVEVEELPKKAKPWPRPAASASCEPCLHPQAPTAPVIPELPPRRAAPSTAPAGAGGGGGQISVWLCGHVRLKLLKQLIEACKAFAVSCLFRLRCLRGLAGAWGCL